MASSLLPRSGAKPPSSPTAVLRLLLLEHALEAVVDLGADAQRLLEAGGADRHDHELLQVDVVVGVLAAVHDVHHGHRQRERVDAADVLVERQLERRGGGVGGGQRDAEDGVGAELGLVRRAVELDEHAVDEALVGGVEAHDLLGDHVVDVVDGACARPCRGTRRRRRAARRPRTRRWTRRRARRRGRRRPDSSSTSTSTVGLPRESRICRAVTSMMVVIARVLLRRLPGSGPGLGVAPPAGPGRAGRYHRLSRLARRAGLPERPASALARW